MSSPEINPFKEADSCSACPVGQTSLVPNDDTSETICQENICPPTQVLHSNKAGPKAISGMIGDSVTVTCNPGWSGSGTTVCDSDLRWNSVPTCVANICTCPNGTPTVFDGTGATLCDTATVDCSVCSDGYTLSATAASESAQTCDANTCTPTGSVANSNKVDPVTITGTTGQSVEVICNAGYVGTGTTVCQPSGQFSTLPTCVTCELGKYNDNTSRLICKDDCGAGFYIVEDKSSCVICPYGTWQDLQDQSSCKKCAVGKISKNEQQTSNTTCEECDVGFYNPYEGYDGSCLPCQKAKESGEHECPGCEPGKYKDNTKKASDSNGDCTICALGKFTDDRDVGSCKSCPKGFYTNNQTSPDGVIRRNRCQECHRGTYGDVDQQETKEECKQCGVGRYSDTEGVAEKSGKVVCKACKKGTYSTEKGNDKESNCKNCGSGRWSSTEAVSSADACKQCSVGKFSADVGVAVEALCKPCDLGFEQVDEGKAFCLPCTAGKFGTDGASNGIRICSNCVQGQYQSEMEQTTCLICDQGKISSNSGASTCETCQNGNYQTEKGQSVCKPCKVGRYRGNDDKDSTQCIDCKQGKISSNSGASTCETCQNGNYQTEKGQSVCKICDVGRFKSVQAFEGSDIVYDCKTCPIGYYAQSNGSVSCFKCSAGRAGEGCNSCKVGRYRGNDDKDPTQCQKKGKS